MNEEKIDLAIAIIKEKIAKEIKQNKETKYQSLKNKIQKLREEEKEIYKENEEIINKVLTKYAQEVKSDN